MNPEELAAAMGQLRVFPLPGTVMLPGVDLPLRVFEPRYRALVADALAGDRLIAVPQIVEGFEDQHFDRPDLYPLCTVGIISEHRAVTDEIAFIILRPLARVRLLEELPAAARWRSFRAHVLADDADDTRSLGVLGMRIRALLKPSLGWRTDEGAARAWRMLQAQSVAEVPASAAAMFIRRGDDRQTYLSNNSPIQRARFVEVCVIAALAEARGGVVAEA